MEVNNLRCGLWSIIIEVVAFSFVVLGFLFFTLLCFFHFFLLGWLFLALSIFLRAWGGCSWLFLVFALGVAVRGSFGFLRFGWLFVINYSSFWFLGLGWLFVALSVFWSFGWLRVAFSGVWAWGGCSWLFLVV